MAPELKMIFWVCFVELLKKLSPNDFADTNADCKNMRSIKNVKKRRVICIKYFITTFFLIQARAVHAIYRALSAPLFQECDYGQCVPGRFYFHGLLCRFYIHRLF